MEKPEFCCGVDAKQQEEIKEIEQENKKLIGVLTGISNMCIGDLAMGYSLDAGSIGNMIYTATLKTNSELNEHMKRIESK